MAPSINPTTANSTSDVKLAGHVGHLTTKETEMLKQMWSMLTELFQQPGTELKAPEKKVEEAPAKKKAGGWGFGRKEKKESTQIELFLGATIDPSLLSLPIEKAIPQIPGSALRKTFWSMVATDNPDAVILRFLRARKWDLDAAYKMLINTLRWRLVMRVDEITALGETGLKDELEKIKPGMGECLIQQLHSGKAFLGGPDKSGRGICFVNVRFHHKDDQPLEILKILTILIMETSRLVVAQPTEAVCIVFNLDRFTLSNMDYDFVKFLLTCFEAYYPETLGSCQIYKAPWVFSTVWAVIKPWLDPVVASKINFADNLDQLTQFIDMGALPSCITGETDKMSKDEIQMNPPQAGTLVNVTPAIKAYEEAIDEYEQETTRWISASSPEEEGRKSLARKYRNARIQAENDIRGSTSYHVKGLVQITDEGRLVVDYGSEGWVPKDITDTV
ncbi:hypothetical protein EC973_002383 [Apophysomyces ossiformis]|uniref:CRAL-TRIO domain-containing protein n=1 Tax=Apophysomyces ossiformis TaxID=679940 RepID=A0A8H7BNT5_9FUNG|nr:hypothetical protein EC973_002383 [Apophysomyces ossiformis]